MRAGSRSSRPRASSNTPCRRTSTPEPRWRGARPTCTEPLLARGPQGQVGCGLGQTASTGEVALIVPTVDIPETGETHTIDGVEIEFQMAPGTEAPAEMHFYFPKFRALCMAENATHNLHNLLTLRGALVRDPHGWSGYLTEAIDTLRRSHRRRVRLPPLADLGPASGSSNSFRCSAICMPTCTTRPCGCSIRASPASRSPRRSRCRRRWKRPGTPAATTARSATTSRPSTSATWAGSTATRADCGRIRPRRSGPRYVEAIGGIDRVVEIAQQAFDDGDFRWAATLLDHAIFTDENHAGGARTVRRHARTARLRRGERGRGATSSSAVRTELRDGNFGTPTPDRVAVDNGPAHAGADVRHLRHQRQRATGVGSRSSPWTSRSSTSKPTTG